VGLYPVKVQIFLRIVEYLVCSGGGVRCRDGHGNCSPKGGDSEHEHAFEWAAKKGPEGLVQYREEKNRISIDGLPTALGKV
jgi:hypothetical protein